MTKHGAERRARAHRGIKVLRLRDGRHVARWRDPIGGALLQQSLDRLGLTSDRMRRQWAARKAEQLGALSRAVSVGAVTAERMTPAVAVADYLAQVADDGTRENKRIVLDTFAAWCERGTVRTLPDLSPTLLMRWRDHVLSPKRCAHEASTRNRWLIASGIFLRWALKRGLVPLLNSDAIRHGCERAPEPQKAIEFLRPLEVRAVLKAAIARDESAPRAWRSAPFTLALLLSGCRFDELAALDWSEVVLDAGEIRLQAERTKTKRARTIALRESPALLDLLEALHGRSGGAGSVFGPVPYSTWDAARQRMIADHKAPEFTAHTLRRTCGTILTNAPGIYGGASAWHSAKRLGHSVEQAERHYAGQLSNLPAAATTFEAAAGIEDLAAAIVARAKGGR